MTRFKVGDIFIDVTTPNIGKATVLEIAVDDGRLVYKVMWSNVNGRPMEGSRYAGGEFEKDYRALTKLERALK